MTNLNSSIKIPKRKELSEAELKNLKSYKSAYEASVKEAEKRNITLLSPDIESTDLQNSLEIYINLLLDLFDEKNDLRNTTTTTKLLKMNLYLSDITNLKREALLRLKALREVYKTNIFSLGRNKATLVNEIRILENDYLIFKGQEEHAKREIETYKIKYSLETSNPVSEKSLAPKLNELYKLVFLVSKEEAERINNSKISTEIKIAFFEKLLEMYVYKNKEKLRKLEEEFDKLNEFEVTSQNRDNLLENIKSIENYYKIFYYFGNSLINEDQLYSLYELKLYLLSFDMFSNWYDEIKNCDELEKKYYAQVPEKILENAVMGYNEYLVEQFGEDVNEAVDIIRDLCKNSGNQIDFSQMLSSASGLQVFKLILQCDRKNGIVEYFKNIMIKPDFIRLILPPTIVLAPQIPLSTYNVISNICNNGNEHFLNPLFKLLKNQSSTHEKEYRMLEGIEEIDMFKSEKTDPVNKFLDYLAEEAACKTVILPSTLKKLRGNIPGEPISIVLNDGLECLETNKQLDSKRISIPSSIKKFKKNKYFEDQALEFRDYQNSQILQSTRECRIKDVELSLGTIIKKFIVSTLNAEMIYYLRNDIKYENVGDIQYLNVPLISVIRLPEIRFTSPELNKPIIITKDDFKCITLKYKTQGKTNYLIKDLNEYIINESICRIAQNKLKEILADEDSNTLQEKLDIFNIPAHLGAECHSSLSQPASAPKPTSKTAFDYQLVPRVTLEPLDFKNLNHVKKLKMNNNNINRIKH